nr:aminotransferase class V-fold PLP-dependent enzyme [uncultured Psychroserpens sp.]
MEKINTTLNAAYSSKNFKELGYQIIDLLSNHLENSHAQHQNKVISHTQPEASLTFWKDYLQTDTNIIDTFETIIKHSINLQHPRYMGHQAAVSLPIASLGGLISDLLNNGTGVFEMGPASNSIEKVITDVIAKKIGYSSLASGLLTSGGSLANLTALLAARSSKSNTDVWKYGHQDRLAIMVSEEAHYCVDRAARIMGFGDIGLIKIPVDNNFKIRTDLLEDYYNKAKANKLNVIALIGCAGSTATGSYDDLEALGKFCQTHDLWFHVDGAHGGSVIFSETHKPLIKGIQEADSIVIDFHKMLMTPGLNTMLLFKKGKTAYETFKQKAKYLWDESQQEEWYNSGKRTFECTKSMMSIKIYLILKSYGEGIFEQNIDALYDSTKKFAKLISQNSKFELLIEPESNILNFRFIDIQNKNKLNAVNSYIRQFIVESGKFYIVQTMINDNRYLRCTIMNPFTTSEDFLELLMEIEKITIDNLHFD